MEPPASGPEGPPEALRRREPLDATGYLAAAGLEEPLLGELHDVLEVRERLVLARGPEQPARWAQNVWRRPVRLEISSIRDGARQLRGLQRNWALYSTGHHRRAQLIQEALPHVSARPLQFPSRARSAPLGSWTLLGEETILAAADCSSPFPHGEAAFAEPPPGEAPPTRAFLKLWEALALLGRWPRPGERCLDAGCSPGGWTWALARLGARVVAVDRAPLAPAVAALPGVEYRAASAFSVQPRGEAPFDWIFSDVICYPERLLQWVERWVASGRCRRYICTLKFQGREHYGVIPRFERIPGSRLLHLSSNKHELTWIHVPDDPADGAPSDDGAPPSSPPEARRPEEGPRQEP